MLSYPNKILFTVEKPAVARLEFPSEAHKVINNALSYKDKSYQYSYEKLKKNRWAAEANPEKYMQDLDELKSKINQSLLLHDEDGFYTYSGLLPHLKEYLRLYNHEINYSNQINYPDEELLPFDLNYKPRDQRYYQIEAVQALLNVKHGAVSLPTGAGKSEILKNLIKALGFKTLVVAPTKSIAAQLFKDLTEAFGKKYVGMIGDNKRVIDKKITVAIGASLVRITDEEEIKEIQKNKMVLFDESHILAADTLRKVAIDLCADIPYRFFVSATQQRGDGRDLLLESIIGPIVYEKTYRELVDEGYLADLNVNLIMMKSTSNYNNVNNPVRMSQHHYLYNQKVIDYASQLINECQGKGEPTVALFDEKEQLRLVSNKLKYVYDEATADTDVVKTINKFNDGASKLILGTSAIGMGSDIRPIKRLFILQYGSSDTALKQALGRATRLVPGKTSCEVYLFCVVDGFNAGANHFKKIRTILQNMDVTTKIHDMRGY